MTSNCRLPCQCFHWLIGLALFVEVLVSGLSAYFGLMILVFEFGPYSEQLRASELAELRAVVWVAMWLH
jgi:hypothetical protein